MSAGATAHIDPASYRPHALHAPDRDFQETNCYTDIWIELLHARGHEPLAMLAYCAVVDFEGDQWTFFKPPPEDLTQLYGFEVQEYLLYRPLPEHVDEQLRLGRVVIVEVDGYHLPDTVGRSYRISHEKTSIAVESIDLAAERLRYFHGPGFYELDGEDYRSALRIGRAFSPDVLPPYVEVARADRLPATEPDDLRRVARRLLARQLQRRPLTNPVRRFGARLTTDLPSIVGDERAFHRYAFATLRQCGSAWEATASFLDWLGEDDRAGPMPVAAVFRQLSGESKRLLFRLARAAATGREPDPAAAIATIADLWEAALAGLEVELGRS